MKSEADDILRRVREITEALTDPTLDSKDRTALERTRDGLRVRARDLASTTRHPESVATEIEMIEDRLAEIERMSITKGYSEKHISRTIQDPGAYRYGINRMLEAEHADEVRALEDRLAELRTVELRPDEQEGA